MQAFIRCRSPHGQRQLLRLPAASPGGFSEEADTAGLNLACLLEDGQKILVPSKGDDELSAAGSSVSAQGGISSGWNSNETGSGAAGKININRADEQELQKIPGVGKARAAAIAAYRQAHGPC